MATKVNVIKSKNGVELREVRLVSNDKPLCYEIYVDGEYWTRYDNQKVATRYWKDFAA
jgi:hypothetical protein